MSMLLFERGDWSKCLWGPMQGDLSGSLYEGFYIGRLFSIIFGTSEWDDIGLAFY